MASENAKAAVQKRTKIRDKALSPAEEEFCQLYSGSEEFFANGVQSYIEAFDVETSKRGAYDRAKAAAYELLTKSYILKRIDKLLELRGLNDQFVDKQLEFLITQHADLKSKIKAISEYNKLKQRIKDKVEHSGSIQIGWQQPK